MVQEKKSVLTPASPADAIKTIFSVTRWGSEAVNAVATPPPYEVNLDIVCKIKDRLKMPLTIENPTM